MGRIYEGIFLLSMATLAYEAVLTRLFSLAQGFHFAFMAISLALLGAGASGTYLSLRQAPANVGTFLTRTAILFAASLPLSYLIVNYLPFDAYRLAWDRTQIGWLALYYLALTIPFFFSGLAVGAALAAHPRRAGPLYAANLLGSSLGPLLALPLLAGLGGAGAIFAVSLAGWLAVGVLGFPGFLPPSALRPPQRSLFLSAGFFAITLSLLFLALFPPSPAKVRLTPYQALSQASLYPGSRIVFQRWNAFSRIDVVESEGIHSAPGLSFAFPGGPPAQLGLTVDGDNLSPITRVASPPGRDTFTTYLPLALPFQLRPGADVLILEPGGGLAVLAALQNGAASVTVVESNPTIVEAVRDRFGDTNGHLYADPRVRVVIDHPRSFLRRNRDSFDLIILPLTDSFRPVTAGAYTLAEDYNTTVEAFGEMAAHLSPDGLLVTERWLQLPPTESLRLWGTILAAWRAREPERAGDHLAVLRSFQTSLVVAGRRPLSPQALSAIREFARTRQFDLVWLPDLSPDEVNRYSVVPEAAYHQALADLIDARAPEAFFASYPFAVAPPTDDHPYFFHFFRWSQTPQILQNLGKTAQPFGGSGYLVLVALLVLVLVLSTGLILLPLIVWRKPLGAGQRGRFLLYFICLGLGFLFVEIPLLQRFILYLGQPAYAFAVVVGGVLLASGLGSWFLSARLPLRLALPLIAILALIYPFWLPALFQATLAWPFSARMLVTLLALFPLGLLLGVPFPAGLQRVRLAAPELVPWAWAVNGCASVVSAVLAAMVALTWGFSVVLWGAALAYGGAWWVFRHSPTP
ncbi:MAG: hypothetical protein ACE5H9_02090 [Anaerolineae bacterium]